MSRLDLVWIFLLASDLTANAADCCKGSVAIVASLTGEASVRDVTGTALTPASNLDWLAAGVTIETGAKSMLTILLANGRRYELGEHARAIVNADAVTTLSGRVRELQRLPPIPRPAPIASDHGDIAGAVRFRGASPPRDLYPNEPAVALPGIVNLSFSPVTAATVYNITLTDESNAVLWKQETNATSMNVPQGILKTGSNYVWRVRAIGANVVLGEGEARFAVISQESLTERSDFSTGLEVMDAPVRLVLLASVDMQLGLFAEAVDEFDAALRKKPGDPEIQRALATARIARAGAKQ